MCGIAGIISLNSSPPPTAGQILAMCDAMYHRGPDDCGFALHESAGVGMGMRRLSIIDLAGGHQPVSNEDRTVRVVFNGEIYNYRELRRDLEARGHVFRTNTDTEVLVHLWEDHGPAMLDHLDGMFAIALHDSANRKFFLARDHVGIKPLFYAHNESHFVFGSEVKVILASGLVDRDVDVDGLAQFLAWEYVPGEGTLHRSIHKLEAGCMIEIDLSSQRFRKVQYWDVPAVGDGDLRTEEEWADAIDDAIARSVRRQLVADVPLGAFLSGGVDSSLVVASMGRDARTFSIGFDDATYSELPWAQRVARHLGVDHDYDVLEPRAAEHFEHLMHFMDDPIGDFSIFPTHLVSKHARQGVTVALSGDGGDELFGGYETYIAQERARLWMKVPALVRHGVIEPAVRFCRPSAKKKGLVNKAKRFVEGFENGDDLGHARWRVFAGEAMRELLFTPDALAQIETPVGSHIEKLRARCAGRDELNTALYIDFRSYLVDNCLVKVDRMSMACSLEVRVPLLSREVVELAFAVPPALKVSGGQTKVLLKKIAARHVPRECVYRPKEGFSIPMKHWLNNAEFRPLVDELLSPARLKSEGIFESDVVERLKREHRDGRANHSHILWSLVVFQDWRKRWAT